MFSTDRVLRAYLPTRLGELKINQTDLTKRLNNPNQESGPYFLKKAYEDQ